MAPTKRQSWADMVDQSDDENVFSESAVPAINTFDTAPVEVATNFAKEEVEVAEVAEEAEAEPAAAEVVVKAKRWADTFDDDSDPEPSEEGATDVPSVPVFAGSENSSPRLGLEATTKRPSLSPEDDVREAEHEAEGEGKDKCKTSSTSSTAPSEAQEKKEEKEEKKEEESREKQAPSSSSSYSSAAAEAEKEKEEPPKPKSWAAIAASSRPANPASKRAPLPTVRAPAAVRPTNPPQAARSNAAAKVPALKTPEPTRWQDIKKADPDGDASEEVTTDNPSVAPIPPSSATSSPRVEEVCELAEGHVSIVSKSPEEGSAKLVAASDAKDAKEGNKVSSSSCSSSGSSDNSKSSSSTAVPSAEAEEAPVAAAGSEKVSATQSESSVQSKEAPKPKSWAAMVAATPAKRPAGPPAAGRAAAKTVAVAPKRVAGPTVSTTTERRAGSKH